MATVAPSAALNVKKGKWSFNLNGQWSYNPKMVRDMEENNDYSNGTHYGTNTEINADKFHFGNVMAGLFRSEERRVGKECRSGWSRYHKKKKKQQKIKKNKEYNKKH